MYRLTVEQQTIVDQAAAIGLSVIAKHARDVDERGRFPEEAVKALAEAGFMGLTIPAEFGGKGQSLRVLAAVVDVVAQHCGSTAMIFTMHSSAVGCYLADAEKFAEVLRDCAAGRHLGTLAFSEKGSRSQFWAPVSKAVAVAGGATLSAEKSWVTSAGYAQGIVASAGSTDGSGASVFLVRNDDAGLTKSGPWDGLGLRGNQSSPMTLTNVHLDFATRLIGEDGKGADIMLGKALPVFQLCQGAMGIGLAEAAFKAAQGHITGHGFEHTGTKLMDLPNLRANLAQMRIATDQARAYLVATLDKLESGAADGMLHVLAVKASSGETAVSVTDLAMRSCGGAAFSKHLGLERSFRDARAAIVMAPTTDHLREFIGRLLVGLPLFG
jgi:alkylation response protein AidB-like acyl-CoA dehydrogenase